MKILMFICNKKGHHCDFNFAHDYLMLIKYLIFISKCTFIETMLYFWRNFLNKFSTFLFSGGFYFLNDDRMFPVSSSTQIWH